MWNEHLKKYLIKPYLAVKQDFLLPKTIVNIVLRGKKVRVTHCQTSHHKISRIIWMTPYHRGGQFFLVRGPFKKCLGPSGHTFEEARADNDILHET